MDGLPQVIGDGDETLKKEGLSENCRDTPIDVNVKGTNVNKTLPNGCVKHGLDDNGLIKLIPGSLEADSNTGRILNETEDHEESSCKLESSKKDPETVTDDNHTCNNTDASSMHTTSQNQSECDMDSADIDGDLTASSDGATDSVSTAISRVSISDTESSSRTDSESKPQRPLTYVVYESEEQMPDIMRLITKDLSEPYSIYTYRYFIHNWPKLCFLAMDEDKCVGAIVCKLDLHKKMVRRGYIAMLAVDENYRRRGIGSHLVMKAIRAMVSDDCDEVVLETEITNKAALRLYENLGFVRDKRLFRYYLNGVDALRLKLWLR